MHGCPGLHIFLWFVGYGPQKISVHGSFLSSNENLDAKMAYPTNRFFMKIVQPYSGHISMWTEQCSLHDIHETSTALFIVEMSLYNFSKLSTEQISSWMKQRQITDYRPDLDREPMWGEKAKWTRFFSQYINIYIPYIVSWRVRLLNIEEHSCISSIV